MKCYKSLALLVTTYITLVSCQSLTDLSSSQVNARHVQYKLSGQGVPTVVLETGMGPTIDTWFPIFDSMAMHHPVYAYNRPGYGRSSLEQAPRTVKQVAHQLRENLKSAGVNPPYVLVGHSIGGLYVNMFARLFPDEVCGVLFLDASHPQQFQYFKEEHPILYNLLITSTRKGNRKYEESIVRNAHTEFAAVPPFPNIPISILTAGKKSSVFEGEKLRNQWLIFQDELTALSKNSHHLIVDGSGHYIHKDKPDVVMDELHRMLSIHTSPY